MILIIDDDLAVQTSLGLLLKQSGFSSMFASNPVEAEKLLNEYSFELIILDMNFSIKTTGEEGLKLLSEIKKRTPSTPVILITAWGSIPLAVEGMKLGAFDFINKPWNNTHLISSIKTAISLSGTSPDKSDFRDTRRRLNEQYDFENIIGEDPEFVKVLEIIGRVSDTNASVLIFGESGTGKEIIAEAIHQNSSRRNRPFVKVNLGGISSTLFESEMFGHKKGSFTDAKENRVGRFDAADTGTIFLDEIGDLDQNNQVKLLRVLQDRSFEVLGSSITRSVDVRVVSATNRDLKSMIEENKFREDLFYRINLITIKIPPLRERRDDIPFLVNFYVENLKTIYGKESITVSQSALDWLKDLPWPGNIRELKNLVERTVLVSTKEVLEIEDFSEHLQNGPNQQARSSLPAVGSMTLEEIEITMVKKALAFHNNNISKAARSLGITRSALYRRMEKFGLSE